MNRNRGGPPRRAVILAGGTAAALVLAGLASLLTMAGDAGDTGDAGDQAGTGSRAGTPGPSTQAGTAPQPGPAGTAPPGPAGTAPPGPSAAGAPGPAARPVPPLPVPAGRWNEFYRRWRNGPPSGPGDFPIAVWLQDPRRLRGGSDNARNYAALGVNTFVGLWEWPPDAGQLAALRRAGLTVISGGWKGGTDTAEAASRHAKSPGTVTGYLLYDEPDLNQPNGTAAGGGCVPPEAVRAAGARIRAFDPTRPVFVNHGKGVALYDSFGGRGPGCFDRDNAADAAGYLAACDICSVDYYAVGEPYEPAGRKGLYRYGQNVDAMLRFSGGGKPVWTWIETTEFDVNQTVKITPAQVRTAVWLSLVHGAAGIGYFPQRFKGGFVEDGLLADAAMARAVGALNAEIRALAPVLNGPHLPGATVASAGPVPIAHLSRQAGGYRYLFAMGDGNPRHPAGAATTGTMVLPGITEGEVEVVGEGRRIAVRGGRFTDRFGPYQRHVYRVPG